MGIVTQQLPICELMTPSPNGIILRFYASAGFKTNSVKVYLNGLLLTASMDTGYTLYSNIGINMKIAPLTDDTLQISYDRY